MIALLPLLVQLAGQFGPTLTNMLLGPKAIDVITTATKVAATVFGTTDPAGIQQAIANNPALAQVYLAQIQAETEQFKDALADVASARAQTVTLAQVGSPIAWGAPVVSVVVVTGFLAIVIIFMMIMTQKLSVDSSVMGTLGVLFGYLGASFQQVVGYWVGSSAGSASKDRIINNAMVGAATAKAK